jgi:mlo protein
MLLGFISLLLTVFQPKVASICMPERLAHRMLPCPYEAPAVEAPATAPPAGRRLLATEATTTTTCKAVPFNTTQVASRNS